MIALAFDPGGTTGVAFCAISGTKITELTSYQHQYDELGLYEELERWCPEHIIYESFEFRNAVRSGTELFSRNLIGVIRLHHQKQILRKVRLYEQTPSSAKSYWENKRLKEAGLYQPGKEHANDAMRHMLYWLAFKRGSTLWDETSNHFLRRFVATK